MLHITSNGYASDIIFFCAPYSSRILGLFHFFLDYVTLYDCFLILYHRYHVFTLLMSLCLRCYNAVMTILQLCRMERSIYLFVFLDCYV